jgi:hypothetical protein
MEPVMEKEHEKKLLALADDVARIVKKYVDGRARYLVGIGAITLQSETAMTGMLWSVILDRGEQELKRIDAALDTNKN